MRATARQSQRDKGDDGKRTYQGSEYPYWRRTDPTPNSVYILPHIIRELKSRPASPIEELLSLGLIFTQFG
ncbi:MAG: hypothetical protein Pars93KO_04880 [Parasphingorhabdus sp.]